LAAFSEKGKFFGRDWEGGAGARRYNPAPMKHLKTISIFSGIVVSHLAAGSIVPGIWFSETSGSSANMTNVSDSDTVILSNINDAGETLMGAVAGLSETVSLDEVGDFIQFAADFSGGIGNNKNYSIRIGFFDASSLMIDQDFDPGMDALVGNFGALGTRTTTGARTAIFNQPLNEEQVLGLNQATPGNMIGTFATDITTGDRAITYRVERIAGDELQFTLSDGGNINITRTQAVASASTVSFDSVAVGAFVLKNNSATFDDIAITVVPEPATYALLLGLGTLGLVLLRRRMH
jgi:hypothetical protein